MTFAEEAPIFEEVAAAVRARKPDIQMRQAVTLKVEEVYEANSGPSAGEKIA